MIFFPSTKGSNNRRAILNEEKAKHIFRCAKAGVPHDELAALFGVSPKTVKQIRYRQAWVHQTCK